MYVNSHCLYDGTLYGSLTFFSRKLNHFYSTNCVSRVEKGVSLQTNYRTKELY